MKFIMKETIMMDGEKVNDVDLVANGTVWRKGVGTPVCIFTCHTKANAKAFLEGLTKLVFLHTADCMENSDEDGD